MIVKSQLYTIRTYPYELFTTDDVKARIDTRRLYVMLSHDYPIQLDLVAGIVKEITEEDGIIYVTWEFDDRFPKADITKTLVETCRVSPVGMGEVEAGVVKNYTLSSFAIMPVE